MANWYLTVKTKNSGDHQIKLGPDESVALRTLEETKGHIGKKGVVTIAERLVLDAEDITAATIHSAL